MKNTLPKVMGFDFKANLNWMTGLNQRYIPGSVRFFSIFFTLRLLQRWGKQSISLQRGVYNSPSIWQKNN
jgi:hypothetical protein